MELAIVIVNWKTKDFVRACIQSIIRETAGIDYQIVVVDNASYDGCGEMLHREFPAAKFVQAPGNLGFSGANNLGVKESDDAPALLFLNPDTVIQDRAIVKLLANLRSLSHPGALGARLLNTDLTYQTSCVKAFPTIFNQLLTADALQRRFPMWKIWGMTAAYASVPVATDVDVVSGACIMMNRQDYDEVGGFDESYFMYSEDVDLCLKCHSHGLRNYYIPEAVIVHHGGGGSSQAEASDFSTLMFMESRYRFFNRTRGAMYALVYRCCVTIAGLARLGIIALALAFRSKPAARNQLSGSRKKWSAIIAWALGLKRPRHAV